MEWQLRKNSFTFILAAPSVLIGVPLLLALIGISTFFFTPHPHLYLEFIKYSTFGKLYLTAINILSDEY